MKSGFIINFHITDEPIYREAIRQFGKGLYISKKAYDQDGHIVPNACALLLRSDRDVDLTEFWEIMKQFRDDKKHIKNELCPWYNKCRNGNDGCYTIEPENCVRFLPLEGTHLTEISAVVETPPHIDYDKFNQYFTNWIESMGWSFIGTIGEYKDNE